MLGGVPAGILVPARIILLLPSENRRSTLTTSAKGIKVIDRDGIEAVVARLRRQQVKI